MLNEAEARAVLQKALPDHKVEDGVRYREVYLFRTKHPHEDEADYDPFFSVNVNTGVVQDFDVMNDGDIEEIAAVFEEAKRD